MVSPQCLLSLVLNMVCNAHSMLQALQPGGLVSCLCYTRHDGGMEEYQVGTPAVAGIHEV